MGRRRWLTGALLAAGVAVSACTPPGPPPPPLWGTTRVARTANALERIERVGAWTDDAWFATVDARTDLVNGGMTASLRVFPRTGANGAGLGAPQVVALPGLPSGSFSPLVGEHVVGVQVGDTVHFLRPTGGVWGLAGSVTLSPGQRLLDLTDEWMVVGPGPTGAALVKVYAVDVSGPQVSVTSNSILAPDPSWSGGLQAGFGRAAKVDGDLLAVRASSEVESDAGGVRLNRVIGGGWQPVQTLLRSGPGVFFGGSFDVDDGPSIDRLVVRSVVNGPGTVEVWADAGAGFQLAQVLQPDATDPDLSNGAEFGWGLSAPGYFEEGEVRTFQAPLGSGVLSSQAPFLQVSGNLVAAGVFVNFDGTPWWGFEAWSIDRN